MKIGIPAEIKNNEKRVAITPGGAANLLRAGHEIIIETEAGAGSGFSDENYLEAGASIVKTAEEAWSCEMVMKVKEPLEEEFRFFREDLILFTYLHLAAELKLTKALRDSKVTALAYETLTLKDGSLPLLTPMSEVAGRMSVQIGAQFLEGSKGGKGVMLGGVPGVPPAAVTIVGGGIVGTNAAKMALGLGARVNILDISSKRLRELDDQFNGQVTTIMSNPHNLYEAVKTSDLLIGAVLIPGARAPKLVKESMVQDMNKGSVIVDVAIDQGGSIETIDRITTHDAPNYTKYGVVHYAVANIPGSVSRTSTLALTNNTAPYAQAIASLGLEEAINKHPELTSAINTMNGSIAHPAVAAAHDMTYEPSEDFLKAKTMTV
ncbi:alanine dehydrogenase [Alteribacillus bidgolensis]|uniref:Alanine dehydrogenase n=1 Tax=Alteribacillus bidgolensis TaxID=930129 RepID=A0A1G8H6B2_9BACI|nr:alanine dehydrogenase [Alteribacillus bidgolensis]SDI02156.1 L-alanine dehydrogenase [Alteribacillus bidgolensis]